MAFINKSPSRSGGWRTALLVISLVAVAAPLHAQTIQWTRLFGTTASDFANAVAMDSTNLYVVGDVWSGAAFPGETKSGSIDAFVRKYDLTGNAIWTRQFGSPIFTHGRAVAVDATGVYVAGEVDGALPGQTSLGGTIGFDAYIRKFDLNGNLLWTRQFGTSSDDYAYAVAADGTGVYVSGKTPGALPGQTRAGSSDAFVRKYDANGTELWTQQFGVSSGGSLANAMAADSTGVYVTGTVCCAALPGQTRPTSLGLSDVFLRKYDPAGTALWTTQFGTAGSDGVAAIAVDGNGVYVAGTTGCGLSGSAKVCPALPGQASFGGADAYVKKYDTNGGEQWTDQFGTAQITPPNYTIDDSALAVAAAGGRVYVGAATFDSYLGGHFVRVYDSAGNVTGTTEFGALGPGAYIYGAVADAGGVYLVGSVSGATAGQTFLGSTDAFLHRITPDAPPPCSYSISPAGQTFTSSSGTGTINVAAANGCPWAVAKSLTSFVSISGVLSGSGNGTITYSVSSNTGAARTAMLGIGGRTFTISQSASGTAPAPASTTTLNFPRVLNPVDLPTTGFALLNPGPSEAAVTFTLYSTAGQPLGTASQKIPARGQLAKLASDLFPSAPSAGWVQATSSIPGLQGFWMGGDFSTYTDGAGAATPLPDQILLLTTSGTEVSVANTGTSQITVTLYLYDAQGRSRGFSTRTIKGMGAVQEGMASLFPSIDTSTATHIRAIASSGQFAATIVASGYLVTPSWVVINAVETAPSSPLVELDFPYVVSGTPVNADYTTLIGVTNPNTASQTISLTFIPDSGPPVTATRTLLSSGSLRETARSLFGLGSSYQSGWLRVTGSAPLTGFVLYADYAGGGAAAVPVQAAASTSLLFGHIADLPPWYTGIALLNVTNGAADMELFAMNPDGTLIGKGTLRLEAGTKTAKLLSEILPQTQARQNDGGFIFVRATNAVPFFGVELFFSRNSAVFANVPGAPPPPGITYTPPSP